MDTPQSRVTRRPVQVVLDASQFISVVEPQIPKGKRDFYANNNEGFARHKRHICKRLKDIASVLNNRREGLGYIKLSMRDDALGKSYRPLGTLFRPAFGFAFVGTDRVGEMLFQATPARLEKLSDIIDLRAEISPRMVENEKTQQLEARPSSYRTECGAIHELDLLDAGDKLRFSAQEAIGWLNQNGVIGSYIIELFRPNFGIASSEVNAAIASLSKTLHSLPSGIRVRDFSATRAARSTPERTSAGNPMITMAVDLLADPKIKDVRHSLLGDDEISRETPRVESLPLFRPTDSISLDPDFHSSFLEALAGQSLVRRIDLAPIIESAPAAAGAAASVVSIPPPSGGSSHPVVGIIDGGVGRLSDLDPWCAGRAQLTAQEHQDSRHGTFIAGLISAGSTLNPHIADAIDAGCKYYDIDIFPRRELRNQYFGNDIDYFFDLLDEAVRTAKRLHRARIFNLSFGVRNAGMRSGYSAVADRLDRLARELDVVLVVAAGNLSIGSSRPPWQIDPVATTAMLAAFGADQQITSPGEQLLGLTVAALNPPGISGHEAELPTTYSRRGPGVGGARKPDIAHYGGAEPSSASCGRTGLVSLTPSGACEENCGTSFAAPNVAATLAVVDHQLNQQATRETLLALAAHRARRHTALQDKALRHVAREFVGFGLTPSAEIMLSEPDTAITLAFSEVLMPRRLLEFDFAWPRSLVNANGSCRGMVDLTLAFTPPIDGDHKDEAMRLQLEAHLYQQSFDRKTGEAFWDSRLTQDGAGVPQGTPKTEKYLLNTGLKWSPIKRYYVKMPKGRGIDSSWRLSVKSLSRAGVIFPKEGVAFTVLMTLSDIDNKHAIHDEMRANLQAQGARLSDISIAHRIRPR